MACQFRKPSRPGFFNFPGRQSAAARPQRESRETLLPPVGFEEELDLRLDVVHRVAEEVSAEKKVTRNHVVGTVIEAPRGALTPEFLNFGSNDLTATCLGMSRGNSGSFLPVHAKIRKR